VCARHFASSAGVNPIFPDPDNADAVDRPVFDRPQVLA
jgi:hypothetical protein